MSMTKQEADGFLKASRMMRLASIGADGGPRIVPSAFLYEHGKFYLSTLTKSRKVGNITANSRVAFCVDSSEEPSRLRAVVGKGTATILTSGRVHDEMLKKLIVHLVGSLEHPYAKVMMQPDHVLIKITVTRMTSWNDALRRQGVI